MIMMICMMNDDDDEHHEKSKLVKRCDVMTCNSNF